MNELSEFYTYIYLDPRKPGTFVYGDYTFDYEPFYVGKGSKQQYSIHLKEAVRYDHPKKYMNIHKFYKIKKILEKGLIPSIQKVKENINKEEAFKLEIYLIWAIGRSDLKTGPLTNLTEGGDGLNGYIISKETKRKMSETRMGKPSGMKGKHHSKDVRTKQSISHKGRKHSDESKKKIIESHRGKRNPMYGKEVSFETKQKMRESHSGEKNHNYGKHFSYETKKKMSESHNGIKQSEETKKKISKSIKDRININID